MILSVTTRPPWHSAFIGEFPQGLVKRKQSVSWRSESELVILIETPELPEQIGDKLRANPSVASSASRRQRAKNPGTPSMHLIADDIRKSVPQPSDRRNAAKAIMASTTKSPVLLHEITVVQRVEGPCGFTVDQGHVRNEASVVKVYSTCRASMVLILPRRGGRHAVVSARSSIWIIGRHLHAPLVKRRTLPWGGTHV
jgi:hypothetical protein